MEMEKDIYDVLESIFALPLSITPTSCGFNMKDSQIKVTRLYECGELVIMRACFEEGSLYPFHTHDKSAEHFVCVKGKLAVTVRQYDLKTNEHCDETRTLTPTECMTISVGVEHSVLALEKSEIVAVCIPPEIAYCKG